MSDPFDAALAQLTPRPRSIERGPGRWRLPSAFSVRDRCTDKRPLRALQRGLHSVDTRAWTAGEMTLTLELDPSIDEPQAYRIELGEDGALLSGADPAGVFYAVQTLIQLLRLFAWVGAPQELPAFTLRDGPSFAARGMHLDVSRDKVPTMETLLELIDRFASWKINQLQLYTEHAFAYPGHEVVWKDASPITPDEARTLDRFCSERFIELVPNQQSFGHLHRWLVHEPYRRLAEVPEGIEHPFSPEREPYGLCPLDPGSVSFLAGLYDELLPCFSSTLFNVGLDETVDLGEGRSRERCDEIGTERVYLEFLHRVHALANERGRRIQVFADILLKHPELVKELPADVIPLVWGYEADHPFERELAAASAAGHEVYVCPGTSSWNSLGGRTRNMIANLCAAARHGRAQDVYGYLVTDWGDRGHLQAAAVSEPGFLLGAALAWNADDDATLLAERLDAHVFGDRAGVLGEATLALGRACDVATSQIANGSALFFLLERAHEDLPHARTEGIDTNSLDAAAHHLANVRSTLAEAAPVDASSPSVDELRWTADLLLTACRLGRARLASDPPAGTAALDGALRAELASELERHIAEHRRLWGLRNRTGGLGDSCARLERALAELLSP